MKLAVLSDIHSNIEALEACLARAAHEGAEGYVCLGDIVNYGPDPVATLDRVMALPNLLAVLGNHDEGMFVVPRWAASSEVERAAHWTRQQLRPAHIAFLKDLPYLHHAHGAVFAHAVFDFPNSWEYVVSPRQARRCFDTFQAPMLFLGHVHVPCLYAAGPTRSVEEITPQAGHGYTPAPGCRYLVNVGSVGQPRDGDNAAAFVMYDSEAPSITFHRVPYDFPHTARKIRQAGLHDFYAERLASGQ